VLLFPSASADMDVWRQSVLDEGEAQRERLAERFGAVLLGTGRLLISLVLV